MTFSYQLKVTALFALMIALTAITWKVHNTSVARTGEAATFHQTLALAETGNADAQAKVGYMYSKGQGVLRNDAEALRWLRRSADQGNAKGEEELGYVYSHGLGIQQDYGMAFFWYRLAANQGFPKAENNLGLLYLEGTGTQKDYNEAVKWLGKAGSQGFAPAKYNLGRMYTLGEGVQSDHSTAVRLYCSAAAQGDTNALILVGGYLTQFHKIILFLQFCAGIWLSTDFFSYTKPDGYGVRSSRERIVSLSAGIMCLFVASFTWYCYDHHRVHSVSCGFDPITVIRGILNVAVVILLVSIIVGPGRRWLRSSTR